MRRNMVQGQLLGFPERENEGVLSEEDQVDPYHWEKPFLRQYWDFFNERPNGDFDRLIV